MALAGTSARADMSADLGDALRAYDGGDYPAAFAEFHRLADAGDPTAQTALADMYLQGFGTRADAGAAARWYARGARQGEPIAQLNLGEMYADGRGVARDMGEAWFWLAVAARAGNGWAADRRDALAPRLAPAQLTGLRARLKAWTPRPER